MRFARSSMCRARSAASDIGPVSSSSSSSRVRLRRPPGPATITCGASAAAPRSGSTSFVSSGGALMSRYRSGGIARVRGAPPPRPTRIQGWASGSSSASATESSSSSSSTPVSICSTSSICAVVPPNTITVSTTTTSTVVCSALAFGPDMPALSAKPTAPRSPAQKSISWYSRGSSNETSGTPAPSARRRRCARSCARRFSRYASGNTAQ